MLLNSLACRRRILLTLSRSTEVDFQGILALPYGVHKFRFIVDGQVRFSYDYDQFSHNGELVGNVILVESLAEGQVVRGPRLDKPEYRWTTTIPPKLQRYALIEEHKRTPEGAKKNLTVLEPPVLPAHFDRVILNYPGFKMDPPMREDEVPQGKTGLTVSELPPANDVLLNHLTACATRSGLISVGCTTRYRQKVRTSSLLQ